MNNKHLIDAAISDLIYEINSVNKLLLTKMRTLAIQNQANICRAFFNCTEEDVSWLRKLSHDDIDILSRAPQLAFKLNIITSDIESIFKWIPKKIDADAQVSFKTMR